MLKSEWAPNECVLCGMPAYNGFGVPSKCIRLSCDNFDEETRTEYRAELDAYQNKRDEDETPIKRPDTWYMRMHGESDESYRKRLKTKPKSMKDIINVKIDPSKVIPVRGFGTPIVFDNAPVKDTLTEEEEEQIEAIKKRVMDMFQHTFKPISIGYDPKDVKVEFGPALPDPFADCRGYLSRRPIKNFRMNITMKLRQPIQRMHFTRTFDI